MTTTALSTDGLVRTLDDVAAIAEATGLTPVPTTNWWHAPGVRVHCWPTLAFQVAVYAMDAQRLDQWSAIFDYETPADLIAHTIRRAQGGAA